MADDGQMNLFEVPETWREQWKQMPEFVQKNLEPFKTIYVHFENLDDLKAFEKLVDQTITMKTISIWYPKLDKYKAELERWVDDEEIQPPAMADADDAEDLHELGIIPETETE